MVIVLASGFEWWGTWTVPELLFESICADAGVAINPIPERNVWPLQFPSI